MSERGSTAVLVLAAGSSTRMGRPKQLLDFRGQPLLRHAALVAQSSGCSPVLVVLGYEQRKFRAALNDLDVEITVNDQWAEGMGRSIQAGLETIGTRDLDGAILALADQPFVTAAFLKSLVTARHDTGKLIIASRYSGTVGVPAYFARKTFPLLAALEPNQGCKGVILANLQNAHLIDCPDAALDVDTPEDYLRIWEPSPPLPPYPQLFVNATIGSKRAARYAG